MKEREFWINPEIVNYFVTKDIDPRVRERLEKVGDRYKLSALDLGCGGGRHTELLAGLGFDTFACDASQEMLTATRDRLKYFYNGREMETRIVSGSITNIPFDSNQFDVVVSTGVLHLAESFDEFRKAVTELNRVLKPQAIVSLNLFTNKTLDETYLRINNEKFSYITKEGFAITLLPKQVFYSLMESQGLFLEEELAEDDTQQIVGPRAVLRANFYKR